MSYEDEFDRPFEEVEQPHWGALRDLCKANCDYFAGQQDDNAVRIRAAQLSIVEQLERIRPLYREIAKSAPKFDFDPQIQGNGYRSFLILVDNAILHSCEVTRYIYCQRDSMLFRKNSQTKEIESCSQVLASLFTCLEHLKSMFLWDDANLLSDVPNLCSASFLSTRDLLLKTEEINQYCFFGRCLGFQYCDSLRRTLRTILTGMASFSEVYYSGGSTMIGRCTNSVKYLLDPEARARRIVNVFQHADVSFIQSFYQLNNTDLIQAVPSMMMPSLSINQVISIAPEDLSMTTLDGSVVPIPVPTSHIGKKPIHARLLSAKRRLGMVGSAAVNGELLQPSDYLIIHCPGGNFVTRTSCSHLAFLRSWAVGLDVPLLSIEYSTAPEAPYPRALEEILYSYVWALKHAASLLGSNASKVIFIGHSSGGNLALGAVLKCLELNIKIPDGIFMAYAPIRLDVLPSPSRLLCLTDPMLPFGFSLRCLKAYASQDLRRTDGEKKLDMDDQESRSETESFAEVSESDLIALALSANDDNEHKLASLPSDSTLNSVSLTDVDALQELDSPKEASKSQEYIKRLINMYKNASFAGSASLNNTTGAGHSKENKSWSLFGWNFGKGHSTDSRELDVDESKPIVEQFVFDPPKDHILSPYYASDELLKRLPPVKVLSTELDPYLDDCVTLARRLKNLGNPVSLDILTGLSHGFLHFSLYSKEASDGADVCMKRIKELMT